MNTIQKRIRNEKIFDISSFLLLCGITFLVLLPIWWIMRSSLMNNDELFNVPPWFFPKNWRFSNYADLLPYFPYWRYLGNTALIIVPSVTFGVITATMCGFAFARLRFPGKKIIFALCVGSMLLPGMVTLIPLFLLWSGQVWRMMGLNGPNFINTYWPLILPWLCGGGAFNIFLIRQFITTIPRELDEAAYIDGAGHFTILARIIIPNIKPAMIVVGLFIFVVLWNDLLQQIIYIHDAQRHTIAIGLTRFRSALVQDHSSMMGATVLSFIPGIIIYLIGQKHFVEGITLTGMKS
jgi:multiple sugar transport system permease protein